VTLSPTAKSEIALLPLNAASCRLRLPACFCKESRRLEEEKMKNSKLKIGVLVPLLAALFLCLPGFMTGNTKGNPDVTATIDNCPDSETGTCFNLRSDGQGTYTSLGADEVFSSSMPAELNNWDLNLGDSNLKGREVCVTFSIGPNGCYSGATVQSRCFNPYPTVVKFWTIGDGSANPQTNCSLNVGIDGYLIAMSPEYSSQGSASAIVKCTSPSGSPCTAWTITGSGTAVVFETSHGGKETEIGTADNNFQINVAVE
jgi:hypothetical protein